jgi:hypothetical protein
MTKQEALQLALDERIKECTECWKQYRYYLDQAELSMIKNDKLWRLYIKKVDKINDEYNGIYNKK